MHALYNEFDPFACDWLAALIARGAIAPGRVERRSILELKPADVAGPGQRHFFAGIGVWSYALRLADVSDDVSVWTGSCPCQPFSAAGKRGGFDDERHLWPAWFSLIRECRPAIVFGEQVASPDGLRWLDLVQADLEACDYAVGAAVTSAAGIGAPHIRHRIYFVAHARERGREIFGATRIHVLGQPGHDAPGRGEACELANDAGARRGAHGGDGTSDRGDSSRLESERLRAAGRLGDACGNGDLEHARELRGDESEHEVRAADSNHTSIFAGATRGFWSNAEWLPCIDGKARPVEPGTFPLAHGAPARVGRLRGYGNGLVSEQAATFIKAARDAIQDER